MPICNIRSRAKGDKKRVPMCLKFVVFRSNSGHMKRQKSELMVQKTGPLLAFSNNFNKLLVNINNFWCSKYTESAIFRYVTDEMMSFDKTGYQLTLFPLQPSTSDDINHGNESLQRESHFYFS